MGVAVRFDTYGDLRGLHVVHEATREPGANEVRVRAEVLGVNPVDWKIVLGYFREHSNLALPAVPGNEGAGAVSAVGSDVTEWRVGDPVVWSSPTGSYRSELVIPSSALVRRPESLSAEEGAVLPVAAGTAFAGLSQIGCAPEDVLLVHGGAGGVGLAVIQIARHWGARVIATASEANHDALRALGAEPVTYGPGLASRVRALARPTAVFDAAGGEDNVAATLDLVDDLNRVVSAVPDAFTTAAGVPLVVHRSDELAAVVELAAAGHVKLPITARFDLDSAAEALELSRTGHVRGKIVLVVGESDHSR